MKLLFPVILTMLSSLTSIPPDSPPRLTVIAHRGDHADAPENTIAAYQNAIAHKADYVEVDIRATADHKLIVMHDKTVDRTTNGKGKVAAMTLDQIRQLNVIDKKNPGKKHKVPTFEEVLTLCKNKINIYLDFKDGNIDDAWKLMMQYDMQNSVAVYLNHKDHYTKWREVSKGLPLIASLPDSVNNPQKLNNFLSVVDVQILDGRWEDYSQEMVTTANKMGTRIWLDVQAPDEGPETWGKAISLNIQGMQTDHLIELQKWLECHK